MPDANFEHPRLVAIYDALEGDRSDLDLYVALADDFGARRVLDLGCGTGALALLLAARGVEVIGVDPAAGSLRVARAKAGADRVRWVHGDAAALPPMRVDLATMTGNVAQAIVDPRTGTAHCVAFTARCGLVGVSCSRLVTPRIRAWRGWTRAATYRSVEVPGVGALEHWVDLIDVDGPLVAFRQTWAFASDGAVLTSDSTLRFRERDEVEAALLEHGYVVDDVLGAADGRRGRELVFVASRPAARATLE